MTIETLHTLASETDTKLVEALIARQKAVDERNRQWNVVRSAAGQKLDYRSLQWSGTLEEAIDFASEVELDPSKFEAWVAQPVLTAAPAAREQAKVIFATDEQLGRLDEVFLKNGGWNRFYLVTNTNGHIHSSTSCQTCFPTTQFAWLTDLSGLTQAEAVEAYGEILCSVCFPSAPVAWTTGVSKASKEAKDERAAAKAERQAKKVAKALVPTDIEGGLKVNDGRDRITTIAAAKSWLTEAAMWRAIYITQGEPGKSHPSYTAEDEVRVADALSLRENKSWAVLVAEAEKRAAKRLK